MTNSSLALKNQQMTREEVQEQIDYEESAEYTYNLLQQKAPTPHSAGKFHTTGRRHNRITILPKIQ